MKRSKLINFILLGIVMLTLVDCAGKKPKCGPECNSNPEKEAAEKAARQAKAVQLTPKEKADLQQGMDQALNNLNDGGGGAGIAPDPAAPGAPEGLPDAAPALMRGADGQTLLVRQGLETSPAFNNPFLNPAQSEALAMHKRQSPRGVASVPTHGGLDGNVPAI
jgi:hypothetical protein